MGPTLGGDRTQKGRLELEQAEDYLRLHSKTTAE